MTISKRPSECYLAEQTAHRVHETKRVIPNPEKSVYPPLVWETTPNVDRKSIDRNLFEYLLAGSQTAIKAAFRNGEREVKSPNYLALIINRIHSPSISFRRVGKYLEEFAKDNRLV